MKAKLRATHHTYTVEIWRPTGIYEVETSIRVVNHRKSIHSIMLSGPRKNLFEAIFGARLPDDVRAEAEEAVIKEWKLAKI
jgi:hypothetical protein